MELYPMVKIIGGIYVMLKVVRNVSRQHATKLAGLQNNRKPL